MLRRHDLHRRGLQLTARGPSAGAAGPAAPRLSRNAAALAVVSLLTDVSSEMTLTVLPLFLANVLGAKTAAIGLVEGLGETASTLARIPAGWLSDRFRTRKLPTLLGYALSALTKPLLVVAACWEMVAAIRVADRLGKGIRTPPRDALIADSADAAARGRNFGWHRAGDTAGAVLGLALTALVVHLGQRDAGVLQAETYRRLVVLGVLPGLLALAVLQVVVREPPRQTAAAPADAAAPGRMDARLVRFLVVTVLFTLGNSSDAFLVLRAQSLGLSVVHVLALLVAFNVVYAVVAAPAGILSDRLGRSGLLLAGWGTYAAVYLGFALADAAWQLWAAWLLYGVYYGVSEGVARALVADLAPAASRGTAYGAYNAAVGLTALPASVIAGLLWQGAGGWAGFGPRAPFVFGAAMALLAAALLWRWFPPR